MGDVRFMVEIQRQSETFGIFEKTANPPAPTPEDLLEIQLFHQWLDEHQHIEDLQEHQNVDDLAEHREANMEIQRQAAQFGIFEANERDEHAQNAADARRSMSQWDTADPDDMNGYGKYHFYHDTGQIPVDEVAQATGSDPEVIRMRRRDLNKMGPEITPWANDDPPPPGPEDFHQGALADLLSGPKIQPGLLNW